MGDPSWLNSFTIDISNQGEKSFLLIKNHCLLLEGKSVNGGEEVNVNDLRGRVLIISLHELSSMDFHLISISNAFTFNLVLCQSYEFYCANIFRA